MTTEDYYARLGLTPKAELAEIKACFRKLAFKYHPDRNPNDRGCAAVMQALSEAYAVLSHPAKRAEYDSLRERFGVSARARFRHKYSEHDIFNGSDIDELLANMGKMLAAQNLDENGKSRLFYWNIDLHNANDDFKGGHFLLARYKETLANNEANDVIWIKPQLAQTGGLYAYKSARFNYEQTLQIPPNCQDGHTVKINGITSKTGDAVNLTLKVFIK